MNRVNSATKTQPPLRPNLPTVPTSFVGRKREIAEIMQLLASMHLVSLVGAGGCGKTRIALRVAAEVSDQFADGVYWVALARLGDPMLVPHAVAKVLSVVELSGRSLMDTLSAWLCERQLLLVLDNCEHLLGACAQLIEALVSCPNVKVLATSREPLGVGGETLYPVLPLALPAAQITLDELGQVDSVQLFVERAQSILPNFDLTPDNAEVVARICRDLDGIPLAIELASARVNILSVQQILTRLDRRLDLLVSTSRVDARHRTLRAAIDWSYDLLSSPERLVLQRLAVFAAGFTLDTAESVCAGEEIQPGQMLDLLSSLINKSLIVAETIQVNEARYRLLDTMRQYAQEKLAASGEWHLVHDRYLVNFLRLVEEIAPKLHKQYQQLWFSWLETELDNIRVALASALEKQRIEAGLRIAAALYQFWTTRSYVHEGFTWFERLLPHAEDTIPLTVRVKALTNGAWLAMFLRDAPTATAWSEAAVTLCEAANEEGKPLLSLALAGASGAARTRGDVQTSYNLNGRIIELERDTGDNLMLGMSFFIQGMLAVVLGKYEAAHTHLDEAMRFAHQGGDPYRTAIIQAAMGDLARCELRFTQARSDYEESLALFRDLGGVRDIPNTERSLAYACLRLGDILGARRLLGQSLQGQHAMNSRVGILQGLAGFTALAAAMGFSAAGARLHGFVLHNFEGIKMIPDSADQADTLDYEHYAGLVRAALSQAEFEAEQAKGRALTTEQAIEYALNLPLPVPLRSQEGAEPPQELTGREREVAAMIALGKSNSEIAGELVLSKRTVEKHIANILSKLDFTSRAQVVRWAIENGLADAGP